MRLVVANDNVFDNLMDDKSKIVYNLLFQIKNDPKAFMVTNDTSYIFAQDSRRTPNWLFINQSPDNTTKEELIALISGMVKLNPLLRVNGNSQFLLPILEEVSKSSGVGFKEELNMEVYFCNSSNKFPSKGHMIPPEEIHRERLKELISSMSLDTDGLLIDADDSEKYISSMIHSKSFVLWEDEKVMSMAKVANITDGFARINTIFTSLEERNKGYTRMLVSEISSQLISEGLTPVIYADSNATTKTEAYRAVGYNTAGNISQFAFCQ